MEVLMRDGAVKNRPTIYTQIGAEVIPESASPRRRSASAQLAAEGGEGSSAAPEDPALYAFRDLGRSVQTSAEGAAEALADESANEEPDDDRDGARDRRFFLVDGEIVEVGEA